MWNFPAKENLKQSILQKPDRLFLFPFQSYRNQSILSCSFVFEKTILDSLSSQLFCSSSSLHSILHFLSPPNTLWHDEMRNERDVEEQEADDDCFVYDYILWRSKTRKNRESQKRYIGWSWLLKIINEWRRFLVSCYTVSKRESW